VEECDGGAACEEEEVEGRAPVITVCQLARHGGAAPPPSSHLTTHVSGIDQGECFSMGPPSLHKHSSSKQMSGV
jgi:hypothetical protein